MGRVSLQGVLGIHDGRLVIHAPRAGVSSLALYMMREILGTAFHALAVKGEKVDGRRLVRHFYVFRP